MGPIGTQELILILLIVLLLFGAKKLPEFARGLGKSLGEFRKAKNDFHREMDLAGRGDAPCSEEKDS